MTFLPRFLSKSSSCVFTDSLILGSMTSALWDGILFISDTIASIESLFILFSINTKDSSDVVRGISMYRLFLPVRGNFPTWRNSSAMYVFVLVQTCTSAYNSFIGNGVIYAMWLITDIFPMIELDETRIKTRETCFRII